MPGPQVNNSEHTCCCGLGRVHLRLLLVDDSGGTRSLPPLLGQLVIVLVYPLDQVSLYTCLGSDKSIL